MYIRIKYGFWVMQPVFHIYDVGYLLNPPGIIDDTLPQPNKYTNFSNIDTTVFDKLTSVQQQRLVQFVRIHYLRNKDNIFSPKSENILPYFIGHNNKSFVSFYHTKQLLFNLQKGTTVDDKPILGMITSRPINVFITSDRVSKLPAQFSAYYVDYLCIDKNYRKQGIAPELIQTHHYNQRHLNKNIVVSLFKREEELTGIVPLCVYSTYGFPVDTWSKPFDFSGPYKIVEVNQHNFRHLYDFVNVNSNQFDIVISVAMQNVLELIKTKNIFIYVVVCEEKIVSCYCFRKSCVEIEKGLEVLTCFASISGNCDENIFLHGFKISFWKIAAENHLGFAAIENISHNDRIISHLVLKTKPTITSPTAYFFYNFAYPTFASNKVFIIN